MCSASGAGAEDPEAWAAGKVQEVGYPDGAGPGGASGPGVGAGTDFRGGFQARVYGFRPKRRAQDAIAEIHYYGTGSRSYEWVFEADIAACFDELVHSAVLTRLRRRVGDKRVLSLVKSFLKAGVMSEAGEYQGTVAGTPQGGIVSPLLANIALSVLDEHFMSKDDHGTPWRREVHRRQGGAFYRIVRYADDFVILECYWKLFA
jgi:RNA-directed DNA polymerase